MLPFKKNNITGNNTVCITGKQAPWERLDRFTSHFKDDAKINVAPTCNCVFKASLAFE